MASGPSAALYRDLDLIAGSGAVAGLGDAELLGRFADRGRTGAGPDARAAAEAAFEVLVVRHGPMVRATCRRALGDLTDTDDAFQATFLVLVRRARSVRVGESLGPWLHAVALRVAAKARTIRGRREPVAIDPERLASPDRDGPAFDLRPVVDEELGRLPEKYRAPVVLCHLEGRTLAEAAGLLRCPVGTVSGRLSRKPGRCCGTGLARRGLGASAVAAMLDAGEAGAVPPQLLRATAEAAALFARGGTAPASILQLTRGVAFAMLMNKLKLAGLAASAAVAMLVAGAGYVAGQGPKHDAPKTTSPAKVGPPPRAEDTRPKAYSDDQPSDAMAREIANQRRMVSQSNVPEFLKRLQLARFDNVGGFGQFHPEFASTNSNGVILVVGSSDGRSVRAMNLRMGQWEEYKVPGEARAAALDLYTHRAPLSFDGDDVREVAVFDAQLQVVHNEPAGGGVGLRKVVDRMGVWSRKALRVPAKGPIVPTEWQNVILYRVGGDLYVYSGFGRWSELHLGDAEPILLAPAEGVILARQGAKLYIYSIPAGRWIDDGDPPAPAPRAQTR